MALTIGLYVWVFQSQASLDKKVNKDYMNIRKYVTLPMAPKHVAFHQTNAASSVCYLFRQCII